MNDPRISRSIWAFADALSSFAGDLKQIWRQSESTTQSQPAGSIDDAAPFNATHDTHMTTNDCVDPQQSLITPGSTIPSIKLLSAIESIEQTQHAAFTVEPPSRLPIACSSAMQTSPVPIESSQEARQPETVTETTNGCPTALSEPHNVTRDEEEHHTPMTPQPVATPLSLARQSVGELQQTFCLPCLQVWKRNLGAKQDLPDCKYHKGRVTCGPCVKKNKSRQCIKSTNLQTEILRRLKAEFENSQHSSTAREKLKQEVLKVIQILEISHPTSFQTPNSKRPNVKENPSQSPAAKRRCNERIPTPKLRSGSRSDISMKSESSDEDDNDSALNRIAQHEDSGQ